MGWLPTWASFKRRTCMVGIKGDCTPTDAVLKSSQRFVTGFKPEVEAFDEDLEGQGSGFM